MENKGPTKNLLENDEKTAGQYIRMFKDNSMDAVVLANIDTLYQLYGSRKQGY